MGIEFSYMKHLIAVACESYLKEIEADRVGPTAVNRLHGAYNDV
jgi:hypothetical protein